MRKICLLLSLVLLVSLCACSSNTTNTNDKIDNDTEIQDVVDNSTNTDTSVSGNQNSDTSTEPTEEEKAAQLEQERIACKEYLNTIKVYLCDYSVFDYATNERMEYISFTPDAYPSEKGCSVFVVIDYGDKALKREYSPYFDIVIPNPSKGIDDGVKYSNINTSWIIDDQIGVSLYRLNREVVVEDISYSIKVKDLDITLEGQFEGVVGYNEALSLINEHSDGDSSVKLIDGRAYMLLAGKRTEDNIYEIEGTNKYFVEKEYIYVPLSGGAAVTLTPDNFDFVKPDGLPDNVDFGIRINHTNHTGYGTLMYDIVVGYCCIVELSNEDKAIVEGYKNADNYQDYKDGYVNIFYNMDSYFDNVNVTVQNNGETTVLHQLNSSY